MRLEAGDQVKQGACMQVWKVLHVGIYATGKVALLLAALHMSLGLMQTLNSRF